MTEMQRMDYLCKLAKLSFEDPAEKQKMMQDMQSIIALMDGIKDLDISAHAPDVSGDMEDLREDKVLPSLPVDMVLQNAAEQVDGFIAVKNMME